MIVSASSWFRFSTLSLAGVLRQRDRQLDEVAERLDLVGLLRAFADRGRDSLDVAAAHVTNREDAGPARFEQIRRSGQRPFRVRELVGRQIRAGLHEASVVEDDAAIQPAGVRNGARS